VPVGKPRSLCDESPYRLLTEAVQFMFTLALLEQDFNG
jgi:hypothetical protein